MGPTQHNVVWGGCFLYIRSITLRIQTRDYQTPLPSFFIVTKKEKKVPFLHFMLFVCSEKCALLCLWEVLFICINKCSSLRPKNKKQMWLTRRRRLCFNFFGAIMRSCGFLLETLWLLWPVELSMGRLWNGSTYT